MSHLKILVLSITLVVLLPLQNALAAPEIPTPNSVTMADLGSTSCVPCQLMEPILEELQTEYKGRASILFVDVAKDRATARKFGIRAIPTQIFFDASGKEVWRHAGFLEKKVIIEKLTALLE
jgi:thioredoxin 1